MKMAKGQSLFRRRKKASLPPHPPEIEATTSSALVPVVPNNNNNNFASSSSTAIVAAAGNNNKASVGKKKAGGAARLWMRFDRTGQSELIECDKSVIIKRVSIPARDLRILGPVFSHSSSILGKFVLFIS